MWSGARVQPRSASVPNPGRGRQCDCICSGFAASRFPALPFPAAQPLLSLKLQAVFRRPRFLASPDPQPVLLHLQRALQQKPSPSARRTPASGYGNKSRTLQEPGRRIIPLIGRCGLFERGIDQPAGVGEDFEPVLPRDRSQRDAGGLRDPHR